MEVFDFNNLRQCLPTLQSPSDTVQNKTLPITNQDTPPVKRTRVRKRKKASRLQEHFNLSDAELQAFRATHLDMELPVPGKLWDEKNIAVFRERYVGKQTYGWMTNSDGVLEWDRGLYHRKGLTQEEVAASSGHDNAGMSMKGDNEVATAHNKRRRLKVKEKKARRKSKARDNRLLSNDIKEIDSYRPASNSYRPGTFNCRPVGRRSGRRSGRFAGDGPPVDRYRPEEHHQGGPATELMPVETDSTLDPVIAQEKKSLGREVLEFVSKCTDTEAAMIDTEAFLNELSSKIVPLEARDESSVIKQLEVERQTKGGLDYADNKELKRLGAISIFDLTPKQLRKQSRLKEQVRRHNAANRDNRHPEEKMTSLVKEILQKDPKIRVSKDRRFLHQYDFFYLYQNPIWSALVGTHQRSRQMAINREEKITIDTAINEGAGQEFGKGDTGNENMTVGEALDRELELFDIQMG